MLFRIGFNFTVPPNTRRGHLEIIAPLHNVADACGSCLALTTTASSLPANAYLT